MGSTPASGTKQNSVMANKILTVYSNRKFDEEVNKEIRRLLNDKEWMKKFIAGKNNPEWTHDNNR